jgi:hypothetical protein
VNIPTAASSGYSAIALDKCYYFLGGASHGDTSPFDSSAFLGDFPDAGALRLSRLVLWAGEARRYCVRAVAGGLLEASDFPYFCSAGDNLVNGVQCCFEGSADAAPVVSPAFTSDQDRPARRELVLEAGDRVVSVQCRSGALVDSLEVVTAAGKVLRVGGHGGGDVCKVRLHDKVL